MIMESIAVSKEDIRQDYFAWLCDLVGIESPEVSFLLMAKDLHSIPFEFYVLHDENRAEDGKALREEYQEDSPWVWSAIDILDSPCSMFEMLIALSKRMDFELSGTEDEVARPSRYFWEMIDNLGLLRYSDDNYDELNGYYKVKEVAARLNHRTYSPDGSGGLFPLMRIDRDQRDVEIWYQMQAYLNERYAQ